MSDFILSPNCPVAIQQGTYEADGAVPHFIETLVIYQGADGDKISERRQRMIEDETERFSRQHSATELMAARSCARVIAYGNCPFWRLNGYSNSLETRVQQVEETAR